MVMKNFIDMRGVVEKSFIPLKGIKILENKYNQFLWIKHNDREVEEWKHAVLKGFVVTNKGKDLMYVYLGAGFWSTLKYFLRRTSPMWNKYEGKQMKEQDLFKI